MRHAIVRAWLAALLSATTGASAQADWFSVESEHFVVYSDGPQAKVRDYVSRLETFRHVALMVLGADGTSARAKAKFSIYLMADKEGLKAVRPDVAHTIAGFYAQCAEGASAYGVLQNRRSTEFDLGLVILLHEYAHRLMALYATTLYPAWYVEGFAEYMSNSFIGEGEVLIGNVALDRIFTLKRPWIDFEHVLKPSNRRDDGSERLSFYAQSWLLTHYMLSNGERTQKFNTYFERVAAGEDPVAAFEPATGIPVRRLEAILRLHLENLRTVRVPGDGFPKTEVAIAVFPADAEDYLLSAAALKTCPPKAHGEAILAKLRALGKERAAQSPALRLALARAELLYGDVKTAREDLQAYVASDASSVEAYHLLGRTWLKTADELDGDARREAQAQAKAKFFKAYRLKRIDAPNLYHLARTLAAESGVNPNVLNAAQGARALEPTVFEYASYEAVVDLEAGKRERAIAALLPFASNPHDPQHAARMRRAIEAIKAGKDKSEVTRVMTEDQAAR